MSGATACGLCAGSQVAALAATFSSAQVSTLCTNLISQTAPMTTVNTLSGTVTAIAGSVGGLTEGLNCTYLFLTAALVFVMHGGFAMVSEALEVCAPT